MSVRNVVVLYTPDCVKEAEEVYDALRGCGVRAWLDRRDTQAGEQWRLARHSALASADSVLCVFGPRGFLDAPESEFSSGLWNVRLRGSIRVLVMLTAGSDIEMIPTWLQPATFIDARDDLEVSCKRIAALFHDPLVAEPPVSQPPRVFLCHSSEDAARVEQLYIELGSHGLDPWYDKRSLTPGDKFEQEIERAIQNCDLFLVLLSENSRKQRGFVHKEIRTAIREYQRRSHGSAYILPVRLERCRIPEIKLEEGAYLTDLHWIDVFEDDADALARLVEAIRRQIEGTREA